MPVCAARQRVWSEPLSQLSVQPPPVRPRPLHLLVLGAPQDWPLALRELIASGRVQPTLAATLPQARDPVLLGHAEAVLICDGPVCRQRGQLQLLADALVAHRLAALVITTEPPGVVPEDDGALAVVSEGVSADELWGRLATIRQYRPLLQHIHSQVAVMQRLGSQLSRQFVEVDQELRLASRLQRDFLPKLLPELGDVRFAALYRPATWVSGDVYDIRRLDESHISLYLADAVGHGVAAGLLTMFIRQAVVGKRVANDTYAIVPPGEVLGLLNDQLADQELPNCQFVTACYATLNIETHELVFARGGHPHPIHVAADGRCREVRTPGGLLGVFSQEAFASKSLSLAPGEKFILYSDGLEDVILDQRQHDREAPEFTPEFAEAVQHPAAECVAALAGESDYAEGSLQPMDDQTCLVVERLLA